MDRSARADRLVELLFGRLVGLLAALVLLIALATWAPHAHAADSRKPGLNWVRLEGASQCISAPALAARVEDRVGAALFSGPREAELFVDGAVRHAGDGFDVSLELSDARGAVLGRREMHFSGEDCAVIDDAVTLVIAVTLYPNTGLVDSGIPLDPATSQHLDALFGSEPTEIDPANLPAANSGRSAVANAANAPAANVSGGSKPRPTAASRAPADAFHVAIDGALQGGLGQLPGLALGFGLHAQLELRPLWPIELGVSDILPRTRRAPPDSLGVRSNGQASLSLWYASLAVCPLRWRFAHAETASLSGCFGAELGRLRIEPKSFAASARTTNDLGANLLASAVLRLPLVGPLYARAALELGVPLLQRHYTYLTQTGGSVELYAMPQLQGRAQIGAGLSF